MLELLTDKFNKQVGEKYLISYYFPQDQIIYKETHQYISTLVISKRFKVFEPFLTNIRST